MDAPACLNCGTPIAGRYCSACGQRDAARRLRWRDLAQDLLAQIAELDHPWLRTIRDLTLDPGGTARAFVDGKRVAYVPPLKYAFYILLVVVVASAGWDLGGLRVEADGLRGFLLNNVPVFLMLMVPALVVMLRVLFLRSGMNLIECTVFAFYMVAQLALAMLALESLRSVSHLVGVQNGSELEAVLGGVGIVLLPIYLMYGTVRFFRSRLDWALIASVTVTVAFSWLSLYLYIRLGVGAAIPG